MFTLQTASIFLELVIVLVALKLAITKRKLAGYGLALTFGVYVFYDAVKFYNYTVDGQLLQILFFIATVSALISVLSIYRNKF